MESAQLTKADKFRNPFIELGLLIISAALFSLSFPNPIFASGLPFLAWFALAPAVYVINTCSWPRVLFYGPLWGILNYTLFNYWLAAYHPLGLVLVVLIYAVWYFFLALFLRLAKFLFPRNGLIVQVLVFFAYEFLRTKGFLGYPYGNLAYTQYKLDWFRESAWFWGVWGCTILVSFPSFFFSWFMEELHDERGRGNIFKALIEKLLRFPHKYLVYGISYGAVLILAFVLSLSVHPSYDQASKIKMILVQQNVDPWIGGFDAYKESLNRLIRQSKLGLQENPDAQLLVWSETSFVPAIEWHDRYRDDADKYELVQELKRFSQSLDIPLVLGNGDAKAYFDEQGQRKRKDYNAVLLMSDGEIRDRYYKVRLVPFTEHFPYKAQFPWLYKLLVDNNTSFWEPGIEPRLLTILGDKVGTPICFEDSFPDINLSFARLGADYLLNLTNDSWSKSLAAETQHLAMASFRSAENHLSMVRSTNGGITALIDPVGKILKTNEAFTESFISVDVPKYKESTMGPFQLSGEIPAWCLVLGLCLWVLFFGTKKIIYYIRYK